jgi:6-phosphogluconolactonase
MAQEYKYIGYVGCYTFPRQADPFGALGGVPYDESKIGNGIRAIAVSKDGDLSYLGEDPVVVGADLLPNPSYLAVIEDIGNQSRCLCAVSEMNNDGKLFAFSIDKEDPTNLSQIGTAQESGGSFPCHITALDVKSNEDFKILIVSNYGRDNDNAGISTYLLGDQKLSLAHSIPYSGQGSHGDVARQLSSHTHSSAACPQVSDEMFVADLGTDSIVRFALEDSGEMKEIGKMPVPRGSGPRSIVFQSNGPHKLGHIGVVSLEMQAQVLLVLRRAHDACLEVLGSPVSILPEDWPEDDSAEFKFNEGRWASDVVWSNNGKYIFAAARLHNSVAVFEFNETSMLLEFVRRVSTGGQTPRCLSVSPGGEFLMIAHQHSHDVSSFQIDETTGTLTFVDKIEAPLASCVKLI